MADTNGYRVLVKEKIADAGVDLLRELVIRHVRPHVDVEVLAQQVDARLGDLLPHQDSIAVGV